MPNRTPFWQSVPDGTRAERAASHIGRQDKPWAAIYARQIARAAERTGRRARLIELVNRSAALGPP